MILKYMGVDPADCVTPLSLDERVEVVGKLYKQSLKRSELRDELFVQLSKQTRNNPERYVILDLVLSVCFIFSWPLFIEALSTDVLLQAILDQSMGAYVYMCILHVS